MAPLQELLDNQTLPQKAYKNLQYIDRNTNRLLDLTNQLLDFRKADHGLLELEMSPGNFVPFATEVHLHFKAAADAKNISFQFESDEEQICFSFDRK